MIMTILSAFNFTGEPMSEISLTDAIINSLLDRYPEELGHIARPYVTIGGGLSGARVLLIDVCANPERAEAYNGKAFAKVDQTPRIEKEYRNHRSARIGMETIIPGILIRPVKDELNNFALIIYRPANEAIVSAQSFADILGDYLRNRHTGASIIPQIDKLLAEGLHQWLSINALVDNRQAESMQTLLRDLLDRGSDNRSKDLEERLKTQFGIRMKRSY
jgi:hypothetical protein